MKKVLHKTSFVFLIALMLGSCKKNTSTNTNIPGNCTNIAPWIKAGHIWVYNNEPIFVFADSLYVSFPAEVSSNIFSSVTTYDDGSIYPSVTQYTQPCSNDIYYSTSVDMSNAYLAIKLDGNVGDKWNFTSNTQGGYSASVTNEITGKNISVTVPAGTFTCLKIRTDVVSSAPGAIPVYTDNYYNAQYGLIKVLGNTTHYELVRKNF